MDLVQELRSMRRYAVDRLGRKIVRGIAETVARQSLVGDQPIFETGTFPFLAPIEENWTKIRAELDELLRNRTSLPAFHQISSDQARLSKGDNWKVFILFGFGVQSHRNCARCPETTRLLSSIPGIQSAWFSILAPHYHIPRHHGVTKTVLRTHLGLVVPEAQEKCRMLVDGATVTWEAGKCLVFDDFYKHEVWNETDQERIVLIFDFVRPMRPLGRLINALLMWGIKRIAYFKDAQRNLNDWDEKLERATQVSEKMMEQAEA